MKKVAIIGTNGIPARYGGFETLVEYLATYLSERYDITVFCSARLNSRRRSIYNGCRLLYLPYKANGWQSVLFDIVSIYKSHKYFDKVIILGASGSIAMPFFKKFKHKFIFNFGGLDWGRSKWGFSTRQYLKLSESLGIKYSDCLVSDNAGIQKYIKREYRRDSVLIPYGGDQATKVIPNSKDFEKYPFLHMDYAFTVSRIQSDNNVHLLLDSIDDDSRYPLVIVGNWKNSSYGLALRVEYTSRKNIILLDAIYNQRDLNLLRSNCKLYLHGHSAGGTNPALVEAMSLSLPILAYDGVFNRYTTDNKAIYFSSSAELKKRYLKLTNEDLENVGQEMFKIAKNEYTWKLIASKYSQVIEK